MARACPGLKELELADPDEINMRLESACVAASLQALTNLTSLTRLRVKDRALPEGSCISPAVIDAWSQWSSLQRLELTIQCNQVEDLLVLSQLRSLHKLLVTIHDGGLRCARELLNIQVGPDAETALLPYAGSQQRSA